MINVGNFYIVKNQIGWSIINKNDNTVKRYQKYFRTYFKIKKNGLKIKMLNSI